MKKRIEIIVTVITALTILGGSLSACAPTPLSTSIPGLAQTLAVRTMVAKMGVEYFATATPTPFPTPTAPIFQDISASFQDPYAGPVTATPVPSLTPFGHSADQGSGTYADTGVCKNKATFVRDITVPDNTLMKSGQRFRKVWLVKNIGSCTWTKDYAWIFTFGDRMQGDSPNPLRKEVKPDDTIEVSVDLVAPKDAGEYQGNWMLQDENGQLFASGYGKGDFFWVAIVVGGGYNDITQIFGRCGGGG